MTQGRSTAGLFKAQFIQVTRQPGQLFGFLGAAALLVLIAMLASVAFTQGLESGSVPVGDREIREIPGYGFVFAQLMLGATVITLVTSEWASGSIIGAVATTQRRAGILASKAAVAGAVAVTVIGSGVVVSVVLANLVLGSKGRRIDWGSSLEWRHMVGVVMAALLSTLLAVGVAFVVRRTAAAIVLYIALVMVAPIAFGLIPWTPLARVAAWLPLNASGYMMATAPPSGTGLTVGQGYVGMLAWAGVALAAGWWRMVRTDI